MTRCEVFGLCWHVCRWWRIWINGFKVFSVDTLDMDTLPQGDSCTTYSCIKDNITVVGENLWETNLHLVVCLSPHLFFFVCVFCLCIYEVAINFGIAAQLKTGTPTCWAVSVLGPLITRPPQRIVLSAPRSNAIMPDQYTQNSQVIS